MEEDLLSYWRLGAGQYAHSILLPHSVARMAPTISGGGVYSLSSFVTVLSLRTPGRSTRVVSPSGCSWDMFCLFSALCAKVRVRPNRSGGRAALTLRGSPPAPPWGDQSNTICTIHHLFGYGPKWSMRDPPWPDGSAELKGTVFRTARRGVQFLLSFGETGITHHKSGLRIGTQGNTQ